MADLTYLTNIANVTVDCSELLEQTELRLSKVALRNAIPLYVPIVRINYKQNKFVNRVTLSFNS